MNDLNDLAFFAAVVRYGGFSAAARATGIEKTRLSRRVAALERRLGASLLQRSTRMIALTEAGERFYERCQVVIEGAQGAYESIDALKAEPMGRVRISAPVVLAQNYLAPILPAYMAAHPKVTVHLDATDRVIDLLEGRVDVALRVVAQIEDSPNLVAREVAPTRRIMVASPAFLQAHGQPTSLLVLKEMAVICCHADLHEGRSRWVLRNGAAMQEGVQGSPRLVADDMRVQLKAAVHGIGVALLPEPVVAAELRAGKLMRVLPEWATAERMIHVIYPRPRGMLPSVRSFIDYLLMHLSQAIPSETTPKKDTPLCH
ncbi:transcriptional regulator, LysR family [Magnetococcus marinus MC-1]|uniref:Transcriptional regulator, LysR family n=1 Tax=Magnetococcus marinus (strain ATCC BAA-1437 / JCM 17883 / MC-1) TaxID=156889 RepID=A0L5Q1_MAGMM|nr:LysR substrate-binding domain-containing protein [Magnetococcus marinus]ABK43294.1 transcriptional regulator, LysR family [Magnetococcus marinus MC-1]